MHCVVAMSKLAQNFNVLWFYIFSTEKDKVKEGNPSSRESTNNSTHVVNPGKNMIIEEEGY